MLRPTRSGSITGGTALPSYGGGGGSVEVGGGGADAEYYGYGHHAPSRVGAKQRRPSGRHNGSFTTPASPNKKVLPPMIFVVWFGISVILFCLFLSSRFQIGKLKNEMQVGTVEEAIRQMRRLEQQSYEFRREVETNRGRLNDATVKAETLEKENKKLMREKNDLKIRYDNPMKKEDEMKAVAREEAWKKQVTLLQQATSRESRRSVIERFGPDPHHVKFWFVFPDDEDEKEEYFVIEMAPLTAVPHAVHLFLEQVYHGLWDNGVFYLNGPHVLQAGPQDPDDDGEEDDNPDDDREAALRPFKELQLESLAFPEYSEDFEHDEWTLGMTGRPGGPDWYINKMDNRKAHGPGGQDQHDLDEQADPCFAKVVEGKENLQRIFDSATADDGTDYQYFLEDPIEFFKVEIVGMEPEPEETIKEVKEAIHKVQEEEEVIEEAKIEAKIEAEIEAEAELEEAAKAEEEVAAAAKKVAADEDKAQEASDDDTSKEEAVVEIEKEEVKVESEKKPKVEAKEEPKVETEKKPKVMVMKETKKRTKIDTKKKEPEVETKEETVQEDADNNKKKKRRRRKFQLPNIEHGVAP